MPPVTVGPFEGVGVLGGGTAFPARRYGNADVLRRLTKEAWGRREVADPEELAFLAAGLEETLGVRERAWAHEVGTPQRADGEETTLDLAIAAGRAALADARVLASELSLVLCATSTPHRMTSTLSAPLGAALGTRAACMDTRTGCAAGLFGLVTGAMYLSAGTGPVLLVGTDTFSKVVPPSSKVAAATLADGAGALVLGRRPGAALLSAYLESDGSLGKLISTDGALPPTPGELARGGYLLTGAPEELSAQVPIKYGIAMRAALVRAGFMASEVDLFVPHQPGRQVLAKVAAEAGIPLGRCFFNVDRHANVGAAGWLVAWVEARAEGRLRDGMTVLVAAVGGGMSWGAALLRC